MDGAQAYRMRRGDICILLPKYPESFAGVGLAVFWELKTAYRDEQTQRALGAKGYATILRDMGLAAEQDPPVELWRLDQIFPYNKPTFERILDYMGEKARIDKMLHGQVEPKPAPKKVVTRSLDLPALKPRYDLFLRDRG